MLFDIIFLKTLDLPSGEGVSTGGGTVILFTLCVRDSQEGLAGRAYSKDSRRVRRELISPHIPVEKTAPKIDTRLNKG